MPAYKDETNGTWYAKFAYKDWTGTTKWTTKRGFATKREAVQYEAEFKLHIAGDMDMTFEEFIKLYREERYPRIRESTQVNKDNIIETKILPFFRIEMNDHPGFYVLRLARTSMRDSNQRKAGGKTWNTPRRLPLISRLAEFLLARKDFLSSIIKFPYTDKNGSIFSSVDELPISCRRTDFTTACSASDLTRAGRAFLRDILKIREQYVSGISYIIQHSEYELAEKDPTTYILRRNFATHLYTLGFPIEWCQYYMGHLIEDEGLKRSDFNDEEYLYQMALLLERHLLNGNSYSPTSITIPASGSKHKYVTIENKELNDPISITIICDGGSAEIVSAKSHRPVPQEVDITRQINSGSGS